MRHNSAVLIISIFVFFLMTIPAIYTFFTKGFAFALAVFLLSSIVFALATVMFIAIYKTVDDLLREYIEEKKKR